MGIISDITMTAHPGSYEHEHAGQCTKLLGTTQTHTAS